MPRRVVWYPAGSPAAAQLSALPSDLEGLPLPASGAPPAAPDESAVVLVDLTAGDAPVAIALAAAAPDLPVVALVAPGITPSVKCYAYVGTPAAPPVLAAALRNAGDHARARREADASRRELQELNQIGVSLSAERDTDALLTLILTKAREITHSDAGSVYVVEDAADGTARLRFKLAQNDSRPGPVHRVHPADRRRQRGRARGAHRRGAAARRRLRAAAGLALPRQPRLRRAGRAIAPSPCSWSRWPRPRAR